MKDYKITITIEMAAENLQVAKLYASLFSKMVKTLVTFYSPIYKSVKSYTEENKQ